MENSIAVRSARLRDAEEWSAVVSATTDYLVTTPERVRHEQRTHPDDVLRAVGLRDGDVVGVSRLHVYPDGEAGLSIHVHPRHQGTGTGRRLLEWGRAHASDAAATRITAVVDGDERSKAVALHWGFELCREHAVSAVDPRRVQATRPAGKDYRLVSLEDAGARAVWECHQAVAADDPSGLSRTVPFEDFLEGWWQDPASRPDLGRAAMDGSLCLAFTSVLAAGARAWSAMTGTRPEHRGRGLARELKRQALLAMGDAGVTRSSTANDAANLPMLRVNKALGYRPFASTWGAEMRES